MHVTHRAKPQENPLAGYPTPHPTRNMPMEQTEPSYPDDHDRHEQATLLVYRIHPSDSGGKKQFQYANFPVRRGDRREKAG